MIITSTPLRISFFGGGSDLPNFYNRSDNGNVLSVTIDKSIKIAINRCATKHIRVSYSEFEQVNNVFDVKHDRVRNALKMFRQHTGVEIASFSDVPTKGTGLGSSSSFTVGLVNALGVLHDQENFSSESSYTRYDIAERACNIEIGMCGEAIGKQDQYAAAFGGFNLINFSRQGVQISPVPTGKSDLNELNNNLVLISTGRTRSAAAILSKQSENLKNDALAYNTTTQMSRMAERGKKLLIEKKFDDFGKLLHDGWELKKLMAVGITDPHIDEMYENVLRSGALGGKLLGAGGGGYILAYVPVKEKSRFIKNISTYNLNYEFFRFTYEGTQAVKI